MTISILKERLSVGTMLITYCFFPHGTIYFRRLFLFTSGCFCKMWYSLHAWCFVCKASRSGVVAGKGDILHRAYCNFIPYYYNYMGSIPLDTMWVGGGLGGGFNSRSILAYNLNFPAQTLNWHSVKYGRHSMSHGNGGNQKICMNENSLLELSWTRR